MVHGGKAYSLIWLFWDRVAEFYATTSKNLNFPLRQGKYVYGLVRERTTPPVRGWVSFPEISLYCFYVVVARSESMRQGGGSGTLGTFLVTPEGSWGETDPSMIPHNG